MLVPQCLNAEAEETEDFVRGVQKSGKKIGCEYEYNLRPRKSSWRIRGRCWERPSAMALTVPARCCSWWVCQDCKAQTSLYLGCFSRLYFSSNLEEVKSPFRKNSRLTIRAEYSNLSLFFLQNRRECSIDPATMLYSHRIGATRGTNVNMKLT